MTIEFAYGKSSHCWKSKTNPEKNKGTKPETCISDSSQETALLCYLNGTRRSSLSSLIATIIGYVWGIFCCGDGYIYVWDNALLYHDKQFLDFAL